MFIRSSLVLATLAVPLVAQDASTAFYKAYFMDREQAQSAEATNKAIDLYKSFLAANGSHELAGKAATRCMILLYSTGEFDKARAFAKEHAKLIEKVEASEASSREGGGGGNQEVSQKLMEAMRTARQDGNEAESRRLMAALQRVGGGRGMFGRGGGGFGGQRGGGGFGGQRGGGGFGGQRGGGGFGGRGGRGGGANFNINIAEMKQEDAKKAVATLVQQAERMIDMMATRGQADQADALEAKLDKLQDLVDDGKLKEGQEIISELAKTMSAGRGGEGRGGEGGGNRRRRGGDGGDAGGTGGTRRRRGGDGGDAGKIK